MQTKTKRKRYSYIKIPTFLIPEIKEAAANNGYRTKTEFIRDAVRRLLEESLVGKLG